MAVGVASSMSPLDVTSYSPLKELPDGVLFFPLKSSMEVHILNGRNVMDQVVEVRLV